MNQSSATNKLDAIGLDAIQAIRSLGEIYTAVYYLDLSGNSFVEVFSIDQVKDRIPAQGNSQHYLDCFAKSMTMPEFSPVVQEFVDLSTVEERISSQRIISCQYLSSVLRDSRGNPKWSQCSFIEAARSPQGKLTHVLFATQLIHEAKQRELESQRILEESNQRLSRLLQEERTHTSAINALSSIYYAIYYIDVLGNTVSQLLSTGENAHVEGTLRGANDFLAQSVSRFVIPLHQQEARVFYDLDTLDERLEQKDLLSCEYIVTSGRWTRADLIPAERNAQGCVSRLLVCLRNVTQEKEQEATRQRLLAEQHRLINALSQEYHSLLKINTKTRGVSLYRTDGEGIDPKLLDGLLESGSYEESINAYVDSFVMEEDRQRIKEATTLENLMKCVPEVGLYKLEYERNMEGERSFYEMNIARTVDEDGVTIFIMGLRDVNKEMQVRLKQAQYIKAQSEIIEGLGSEYYSVLLVNPQEDSVKVYRAIDKEGQDIAQRFHRHGYCWSRGLQSYARDLLPEEDRQSFLDRLSLERLCADGEDYSFTYIVNQGFGSTYLQARVSFVWEKDGTCVAVIGTRNVDELIKRERQQEQALRDAFDAAEAANKAKTEFLSNMSHDIRTPMNGIIGMTAIAAANVHDPERVQDCLAKITQASKHMLSLINEVLDMSKIESGKVDLIEEEFNLSDLVDNLLSMTTSQIEEHGHELSVSISNVVHEEVIGDSLRIQKVFTNLIGNAVKYTPDGGKIRISISEKPCNQKKVGCYEFVFEDNGIGMEPEFIERIFEPFVRASDSRVNKIQGTGLGMPISRNIVRMMGGDIQVQSKPGEGSRFTVTMYLKLQDREEIPFSKFVDLDVLVADDDDLSLESCCNMLDDLGMRSEGVSSGKMAVQRVVEQHQLERDFFACIIDWKMPDMNGVETARAIRREVGSEVPIIIISAYDWSDIEFEARAAGVDAFVSKPLFRSRLARTFNVLVGDEGEDELPAAVPFETLDSLDLTGKRALLAEDNDLNAEVAQEILSISGLSLERAKDGDEAVSMFMDSPEGYYDLVLMDVRMPRMNGYDATRAIRALKRSDSLKVPILAMTANAFAEDVQSAKTAGMNEHLAKPLNLDALARALGKWLS